jgi:hypothetical protein
MSTPAAIAAVTATLTQLLQAAVDANTGINANVTAHPPDTARKGVQDNQINLFLYRISIDAAWRNQDPPSIRPGETGQPPLPLVLSYLVTTYGEGDQEILAHRLLGIAMAAMHDRPLLSRAQIGRLVGDAAGSGLDEQVQRVRITPDPRPQDEISRMWATFGTGYRLSVSYDAAVVLIDSGRPVETPMPVLMRGPGDTGPLATLAPFPQLTAVQPPARQPAARPADVLTIAGERLDAVTGITLSHPLGNAPLTLTPQASGTGNLTVQLPDPVPLPAGVATAVATFDIGTAETLTSNAVPIALAPRLAITAPVKVKLAKTGSATTITVTSAAEVMPGQSVALLVGSQLIAGASVKAATTTLAFSSTSLVSGTFPLRLRVDGVDSIPVAVVSSPTNPYQPTPLQLDPNQQLVLS